MSSFFVACDKIHGTYDKIEYIVFFKRKKIQYVVKNYENTIDKKLRI